MVFRDAAGAGPPELRELAREFTDIIVFGEGGPYNQGVLSPGRQQLDARVWVLENGYFRPDWITLERNGVNASQRPAAVRRRLRRCPDPSCR